MKIVSKFYGQLVANNFFVVKYSLLESLENDMILANKLPFTCYVMQRVVQGSAKIIVTKVQHY